MSRIEDDLTENELELFEKYFSKVKLSKQYRHEFSNWLPEISYRNNTTISEILNSENLKTIINSEKMNGPQKLSHIRDELYKMRFPELTKIQNEWESLTRKVNPDRKKIKFIADRYFEKAEIELSIKANSTEEILEKLKQLSNIKPENWNKIIDPFRED
jgi:nitrogen regulatory protein PII